MRCGCPLLAQSGHRPVSHVSVAKLVYRTHRVTPAKELANGVAHRIMPLPGRVSSSRWEYASQITYQEGKWRYEFC